MKGILGTEDRIVWDGASIHHSEQIEKWLGKQPKDDFFLGKQPHYSPELGYY